MARKRVLDGITRPGPLGLGNPSAHGSSGLAQRVRFQVRGPDGKVKRTTPWMKNVACTQGLSRLADMIGGPSSVESSLFVSSMRIGTGTTAANQSDSSLVAATGVVHASAASLSRSAVSARVAEWRATFASDNPAGAAVINEVGLFLTSNVSTNGCIARTVLGTNSVNKLASDTINVSYQLSFVSAT